MGLDINYDSCFPHTMNTPTLMASAPLSPPTSGSNPTTIKMEDLQVPFDASELEISTCTPAATETKPVKKRKSWGQVLPEPKTALPPRKRAKTEDEKEQRRIERVKRNRLAAHNSRERKRQEYEVLQGEKDQMENDLMSLRNQVTQLKGELAYYRTKYPGEAPELAMDFTPLDSSYETVCPASTSASFPSPISSDSMDSPSDSYQPETPASTFMASPNLDSTQYPAAILCDLQCRSTLGPASPFAVMWIYLSLFNLSLQAMRNTSVSITSSTLTSSLKAALQLPQWNPLLAWLTLLLSISSAQPSSVTAQPQFFVDFLMALMQSSLTCRVPLAQHMLATRLSQRSSSVEGVTRLSKELKKAGPGDGVRRSRQRRLYKHRNFGQSRGARSLRLDMQRSMGLPGRQNHVGFVGVEAFRLKLDGRI